MQSFLNGLLDANRGIPHIRTAEETGLNHIRATESLMRRFSRPALRFCIRSVGRAVNIRLGNRYGTSGGWATRP